MKKPPSVHPRLGRIPAPDDRDKKFLMRALIPKKIKRPARRYWPCRYVGDQGDSAQCVGYSWHAFLRASPTNTREPNPEVLYVGAQAHDEWDGEGYDGTSVRGGAKYLTEAVKRIVEYRWAFSINAVLDWLGTKGPVVLGTEWFGSMFDPNDRGIVSVEGSSAGGHAYLALGYDDRRKMVRCLNSWGREWSQQGRFWIRYDDLDSLLKMDDAEACVALEIAA